MEGLRMTGEISLIKSTDEGNFFGIDFDPELWYKRVSSKQRATIEVASL
jgi:hypothetical protein